LGNIRVSYFKNTNGSAEVLEENNFYPFGMKHEGYNQTTGNPAYSYQYNGKELQKETGWSDFGARMYMSDIARWGVIDPLAETTTRVNPYNYALNNPVMFIDPDGRKAFAPEPVEDNIPRGGLADFYLRGGNGSYNEFLGKDMLLFYKGANGAYGGGGSSTGGMTFTGTFTIQFLQGFFGNGGSVDALFSFVEQLKNAGFKDPANTKPKFEDASKISKISAISDLVSILNYVAKQPAESNIFFEKTNNWMVDGQSQGYKILLNVGNIDSVLELAYVIGHETNHSITDYFRNIFYETVGSKGPMGRNALGYFTELISYSWEEKWGNTRRNMNASDYTYYMHGPNSPSELLRHSQNEVDLVNKNMKTLLNLYNKFITIPK